MLREWLHPLSVTQFRSQWLGKRAWAKAGAARKETKLCGWESVDGLLREASAADVLVVARGRLLGVPAPRNLDELKGLLARGIGLCVRHVERHDPILAALGASVGRHLDGKSVHVQIFVTPGGTHGFGWHYDPEHVFIVQTLGIKDYYFRDNTVEARSRPAHTPDFSQIRGEGSPLQTARLIAGDCLYIPARWWHMARCLEDSLSISLGAPEDAT